MFAHYRERLRREEEEEEKRRAAQKEQWTAASGLTPRPSSHQEATPRETLWVPVLCFYNIERQTRLFFLLFAHFSCFFFSLGPTNGCVPRSEVMTENFNKKLRKEQQGKMDAFLVALRKRLDGAKTAAEFNEILKGA